jgi:hypothetical protein
MIRAWTGFWFTAADPVGLHMVRLAAGLVFLAWLLPLAGHVDALFGLDGWFDTRAFHEAAHIPGGPPQPFSWSLLYLCGSNAALVHGLYWCSIAALVLFTAGLWTRLTAILAWLVVASFTASPALSSDADSLLLILALYLMVGYLFLGWTDRERGFIARLFGARDTFLFSGLRKVERKSLAANVALRLLQVHIAIVVLTSGLHKLQFGDWWAGMALWYPLHPVMEMTADTAVAPSRMSLVLLSLAAYAMLAWEIGFPAFAWRPGWRPVLLGGALIGGLGAAFLYRVPTFGPALFACCLSFVSPAEWHRLFMLLRTIPGAKVRTHHLVASGVASAPRGVKNSFLLPVSVGAALTTLCASCAPVDSVDSADVKATQTTESAAVQPTPIPVPPLPATSAGNDRFLKERIETVINQVKQRQLLLNNCFWTVFHGILGVGPSFELKHPLLGIQVNAIDYICGGGELRGLRFIPTQFGVDVENGEQFISQGHQDQFIAEMAECGMPPDKTFLVGGKKYTLMDFVHHSQMRASVSDNQELSWTIIVLGQYLGTDISWTNSKGEKLRFEDLVRYEVNASVEQAACGGTHRLFGLNWVYNLHLRNGGRTEGVWKDLVDEQKKYQHLARKYQNPDGSFSTEFFHGPGHGRDMQLRMNTTGHILEWLAYSLPESELRAEWMERAVNSLALMFFEIQNQPMEGGTMYHAVHGLRIYYERCFGEGLGQLKPFLVLPPGERVTKAPGPGTTESPTPNH